LFYIIVGASHYHHASSSYGQRSSKSEAPDIHQINRLTASSQSLQAIFSLTSPSTSTSYPHLQQFAVKIPSASAISSTIYRDPGTYSSLCQINNLCLHPRSSLSNSLTQDDNANKSSDEYTVATHLSSGRTTTTPSDVNPNEKHVPIEIRVRCIFLRVGEIDTLNERYTSEIFFEASWYANDSKIGLKYDPQMGHFNPQLFVLNHIGDSLRHDVSRISFKEFQERSQIRFTLYFSLTSEMC
jgi:hypothetical protein